jgi:ubiquinone/menaquinone biosynthesis C-methylase UbiE
MLKGNGSEHFERWSRTYESSWLQKLLFDRVHRAVLDLVASQIQPQILLDVGCGTGRLLRSAAQRWPAAELIGVDPSPGMVAVARRLTQRATFYNGSAEQLPLPDASVHVALSTMSFHHWQDQAAGVREVARVLHPGGYFFLADVSALGWLGRFDHGAIIQTPAGVQRLYQRAGLQVLQQQGLLFNHLLLTAGRRR